MATTPMMRQYQEAKKACPDALLLFRMGDFYELFYDDARHAARLLGLTLTSREKGENAVPMAGFPYHQLEAYLGRLIAAGQRVAVCDQVEDARLAKGLVARDVTRVVSPGTITDENLLDPREPNYLAAIDWNDPAGLAWVDLSTGRFLACTFPPRELADHVARIDPAECILSEASRDLPPAALEGRMITRRPPWAYSLATAAELLSGHFGVAGLEGFGFDVEGADAPAIRAAGAVMDYLRETQKTSLVHLDRLLPYRSSLHMEIDQATRRSLEIHRTMREARRDGSLLGAVDQTLTAMGSRLLVEWISNPLTDRQAIERRHEAVERFVAHSGLCDTLRRHLKGIHDLQRLVGRAVTGRASPRDLRGLGRTLAVMPEIRQVLADPATPLLEDLCARIDPCDELCRRLADALVDDCPLSSRDGGFIRGGFDAALDALRDLATGGKQWIARYQAQQSERTGIPNIKVGFNKVFGYYLEVTHTHADKVPVDYIRKQTVKAAERYVTPELKEHEEKVLASEEQGRELEYRLFAALRDEVVAAGHRLQSTAAALAELDVLAGLAELARRRQYCRPVICDEPVLEIDDGRHPVLDILEPAGKFVPNSTFMGGEHGLVLILTGPNMAGKSTYIRQVALITLLAHIGSFVPARAARIGIVDRIFARVGASDELARGQSTFMVEMTETARILHTATPRSLVILDEIGRGTSTYDGISLAWSVTEFLHDRIGCRTLFATHYHELTDLARSLTAVRNLNVAVREWNDQVIFLHQIVPGAADKSYGIHVARLAGVPREVNERAKQILARLEEEHLDATGRPKIARPVRETPPIQLTLFEPAHHPLVDKLKSLDLTQTTPLDALRLLSEWQESLGKQPPA